MPWLHEKATASVVRGALASAVAAASVVAAWFAWISTDVEIWLVAALISVLALAALGLRKLGSRAARAS